MLTGPKGSFLRGGPAGGAVCSPTRAFIRHPKTWVRTAVVRFVGSQLIVHVAAVQAWAMDSTLSFSVSWPMPKKGEDPFVDDDTLRVVGLTAADMRLEEEAFLAQLG